MWDTLRNISTPIALIAFIVAALATAYNKYLAQKIELLRLLPEADRRRFIDLALESYSIRKDNLTREQKFQLQLAVLKQRTERIKIIAVVAVITTVIAATVALALILWPPSTPFEDATSSSYRISFNLIDDLEVIEHIAKKSFGLQGKGYLIPSPALDTLESLHGHIRLLASEETDPATFTSRILELDVEPPLAKKAEYSSIAGRFLLDPYYFAKTVAWQHPEEVQNFSLNDYPTRVVEGKVFAFSSPETGPWFPDTVGFVGLRNFNQVSMNYPRVPSFFIELINGNPDAPDVLMENFWENGCGDSVLSTLYFRPVMLLALEIENIGSGPLEIRSIEGISYLRPASKLNNWESSDGPSRNQQLKFPLSLLAPGESLLVPLRLILGSFKFHAVGVLRPRTFAAQASESHMLQLLNGSILLVPQKRGQMKLQDEYIIGSWFDPVSINGSEPLRRFDRSSIVYDEFGGAEGSCPFVFVHDPVMGQWIRVGTIITNRNGREAEGEEVLAIPRLFDGRLLIREIEDEISYIDRIILRAEGAGGEVREWLPSNDALKYVDGVYVTLQHGDEVLVKYPNLPEDVRNIVVVSNGYFVTPSSLRGKRPGAG